MARGLPSLGMRQSRRRGAGSAALVLAAAVLGAFWDLSAPTAPTSPAFWAHLPHGDLARGDLDKVGGRHTPHGQVLHFMAEHAEAVAIVVALVCMQVSSREVGRTPGAVVAVDKRTDYGPVLAAAILLSAVSGMVNGVAIIEMNGTVSHHSGNTSHMGRLLGIDGARFAALLGAFVLGAGVAGYNKADGEAVSSGRPSPTLLGSSLAVAAGALIQWTSGRTHVTLTLWAFSQGLQNGVTSKFTSVPVRTTHMTGCLTDVGSGFGNWTRARWRGEALPPLRREVLFLVCILAFAAGGFGARFGQREWGVLAALVPAGVMAVTSLGLVPIAAAADKAKAM